MKKLVLMSAVACVLMVTVNIPAFAAGSTNCLPGAKCTAGPSLEDIIREGSRRASTA